MENGLKFLAILFACSTLCQCKTLEARRADRFKAEAELKKLKRDQLRAEEERKMREQGYIFVPNHEPARVHKDVYAEVTPGNARVKIDLSEQRAYLMNGSTIAIETPISTGTSSHKTPTGSFSITERDIDHRSNLYGDYVDADGDIIRSGVAVLKHKKPAGARFLGSPMSHFMRLTSYGVGMHIGHLPGYAASHGCIRLPEEIGPMIYEKTKLGTPVRIVP
ncbi:MAG: lipoprotein-anchoring transpeptidase ErfK/SrfK [Verrucomicrobiales bacterium]|jgi:lipoprotein-anchoring transpeptidase ErfK/SrfK